MKCPSRLAASLCVVGGTKIQSAVNPPHIYQQDINRAGSGISLVAVAVLLMTVYTEAFASTWSATPATANWNNASNWDTLPVANSSLFFGSSSKTNLTNDFTAGFQLTSLTFNTGASAYTFWGNSITLGSGGVLNNSTSLQTINFNIAGGAASSYFITLPGGGGIFLGGVLSGNTIFDKVNPGGPVTLAGANTYTGNTMIERGTVVVPTGGAIDAGNVLGSAGIIVGNNGTGDNGMLIVSGGSVYQSNPYANGFPWLSIGDSGCPGFLEMSSGTITTANNLMIGDSPGSVSAFSMSGGTVNVGGYFVPGTAGAGIFNMSGGSLTVASGYTLSTANTPGAGPGVLNMTGGTLFAPWITVGQAALGIYNISGTATLTSGDGVTFCDNTPTGNGMLNLGTGGTLVAKEMWFAGTSPGPANTGVLNFHGGKFLCNGVSPALIHDITAAYVYGEGAVIDDGGLVIQITQPLIAPTGNGVSSIVVSAGGSGYVDTPIVTISGGGGTGAAALATVTNGVVTGITVKNPGTGYTSAPTVTLMGGGYTNAATVGTVTLAANVSGGLTKQGAGTLTLTAANTYTGNTTIAAGTLALSSSGSINNSSSITVAGGATLDVSGLAATLTLPNSQTLISTGTNASGTVKLSGTAGLTLGTSTPLQLAFYPAVPALNVTGGTLTLAAGNVVTLKIFNGGTPLTAGNYLLIAVGTSGAVAGTVPTSITWAGDGLATNMTAALQIISGQLYLAVTAATGQDFTLGATPPSATVVVGISAQYSVTVSNLYGFSGSVSLSASGLLAGATASFSPATIAGSGTSTLTVTTTSVTPGDYPLTITGTSGILVHSTTVMLYVTGPSINWIVPTTTNTLTWGRKDGIVLGLISTDGLDGPRGLIRVGIYNQNTGYLEHINDISVEPVVNGIKGYSETEVSQLDPGQTGKRMWPTVLGGVLTTNANQIQELDVTIDVEKFTNGADTYVVASITSDNPEEVRFSVYNQSDSAAIQQLTLSSTAGNIERLRQLWLNGQVTNSWDLYSVPPSNPQNFTADTFYSNSSGCVLTNSVGDAIALATTDEANPMSLEVADTAYAPWWQYYMPKLTQYWRVPSTNIQSDLNIRVNGRDVYWATWSLIPNGVGSFVPGGIAYENFEFRQTYVSGQQFIFGLTPNSPTNFNPSIPGLGVPAPKVFAQDTWVGNSSTKWSDGGNWTGTNTPPRAGDWLVFGAAGGAGAVLTNDLSSGFQLTNLTFNSGASAYTILGNQIALGGNIVSNGNYGYIVNNSTNLQTIKFPIASSTFVNFTTTGGGGDITLGGILNSASNGIAKLGGGTLTLAASNTYYGETTIAQGTVVVPTNGAINAQNTANGDQVSIGNTGFKNGVLNITGGMVNASRTNMLGSNPNVSVSIGTVAGANGFLEMSAGRLITASQLAVGAAAASFAGPAAYGCLSLSGGTVNVGGYFVPGTAGSGIFNMSDGSLTVASGYTMSTANTPGAGPGVVNITGGTLFAPWITVGQAATAIYNISGTATVTSGWGVTFSDNTPTGNGMLNLGSGGTLVAKEMWFAGTGSAPANAGVLNFHGGKFLCNGVSPALIHNLTAAYVYGEGVVIDDGGNVIQITQPLIAPAGSGVSSIAVSAGGAGYVDTPIVTISGGGGTGAAALATVAGGMVAGITVVNPGTGYTSSPTVTLFGGGYTNAAMVGAVTLAANVSGGLTKQGSGKLTLTAANTYTGNTTIASGTLALGSSGSINNTANIAISAGTTFDVSAIPAYTLSGSTTLSASGSTGTAAIINGASAGTVSLGSQAVALAYDGTHPALNIAQGTLVLNGNAFTVNTTSGLPLVAGTYPIVQQASGSISSSGSYPAVAGTAIGPSSAGAISVSGNTVSLLIQSVKPTTPTNITYSVSGNTLGIGWPANYLGWTLQVHTNALNAASNAWFDIPGTEMVTSTNLPINRANPSVFYRLRY